MDLEVRRALHEARAAEKEQSHFYGALAAQAEEAGETDMAERLNGLHADEQHHLSRLTARLIELGEPLADLPDGGEAPPGLRVWEPVARRREAREVARYAALLEGPLDGTTAMLVRELLRVEQLHERTLGGKWTSA